VNPYLRNAIVLLILVLALLTLGALLVEQGEQGGLTKTYSVLSEINITFFIVACVFFILSVFLWLISWGYLLKKQSKITYASLLAVGFSSLYGALTPVQIGADALRSIRLKELFGIPYSDSISASIIVKGIKFMILAILTSALLLLFMFMPQNPLFSFSFLSGFVVVLLASLLFLLPLKQSYASAITRFFNSLAGTIPFSGRVGVFFARYSGYIQKISAASFLTVLALAFFSWIFEFLALQFSFFSLGIFIPLHSLLLLAIIISVLERVPFLPRGIGLVEVAGYYVLAFPEFVAGAVLSAGEIIAVLIAYDLVRLVVPTLLSILVDLLFLKGSGKK